MRWEILEVILPGCECDGTKAAGTTKHTHCIKGVV